MFARLVSIFAILAIVVVTTMSAAHAARMAGMQLHRTAHPGAIMHASGDAHPSCDGDQHCGSADGSLCEFVCAGLAGLSVLLTTPDVEVGHAYRPASHNLPSEANRVSWSPDLNERPPKLRLL
ncbi:MAG TPA: hypothetical protein GX405_06725 [Rhizobiales bacterium]|nr:hypothetical protein [Hyphomicrobiales bacterium]